MTQGELSRPQGGVLSGRRSDLRSAAREAVGAHITSLAALITLAAFTAAEVVTVFTDPFTGIAIHGFVLSALMLASGFGARADPRMEHPLGRLMLALALVPLVRIVSLTMPLGRFDESWWFVAAGGPVFVSAVVIVATLRLSWRDIGLRPSRRSLPVQGLVVLGGLALGLGEYHILRPEPLTDDLALRQFAVPALILLFATGFLEEFIFRGILQRAASLALGGPAIVYVSLIFAILHIGYRSATDVLFVFVIAMIYAWVVRKTGSILSVSLSHGVTNITLFLLVPFVSALAAQPDWLPPLK